MGAPVYDIAIVGGGASGLIASIAAKRTNEALRVVILERQGRVGKKLSATGNGRCNLTNRQAGPGKYHTSGDGAFMSYALMEFTPDKVLDFFLSLGVFPREETEGRIYPNSDQAGSVVDALRFSAQEHGIQTQCDAEVRSVSPGKKGFVLSLADGASVLARSVILATGGAAASKLGGTASGYRLAEELGHSAVRPLPALAPIKTDTAPIRALKGCKYTGEVALLRGGEILRVERGEILFTEYGVSGIAAMQLSRLVSTGKGPFTLELRVSPLHDEEGTRRFLAERLKDMPERPLEEFLTGVVNKRLGQVLIRQCTGLPLTAPARELTVQELSSLSHIMTQWRIPIVGTQPLEQAQVTAGGVRTGEVDPRTMESRLCRFVYLAGELLDVDGDCGGYNLHWAWASGMLAGQSCARALTGKKEAK